MVKHFKYINYEHLEDVSECQTCAALVLNESWHTNWHLENDREQMVQNNYWNPPLYPTFESTDFPLSNN